MIDTKEYQYREYVGEFPAEIVDVQVVENNFYDEKNPNSTKSNLEITFQVDTSTADGEDVLMHTEKFVSPTTGDKRLFQQLLDVIGELPDQGDWSFDEQRLVGLNLVVSLGKNKKGYRCVDYVMKGGEKRVEVGVPGFAEEGGGDLPWETDKK